MENKKMKHIKIDVVERTITEIDIEAILEFWYAEIGNDCRMVETIPIGGRDEFIIDEEGCFHDPIGSFTFGEWTIVGNALVSSYNDEGEERPPVITVEELRKKIKFYGESITLAYQERVLESSPMMIGFGE